MNILFISMVMPYDNVANGGGQTFNYYIKKIAKQKNINVTLIAKVLNKEIDCIDITDFDVISIQNAKFSMFHPVRAIKDINSKLNPFCETGNTLRASIYESIISEIKKIRDIPDVVVLEFTQMVFLVEEIKNVFPNAIVFASEHDVSFLRYQRNASSEKNLFLKRLKKYRYLYMKRKEIEALKKCDVIMPHNLKDKQLLLCEGFSEEKIMPIVPYYQHLELNLKSNYKDIIFYGAMGREDNYLSVIWFIENVMPLINDLDIRLVILGGNPNERLYQYESSRIVITGYVQNISEYFEKCLCMVAPLVSGAGIKIKVLEAMYAGIAVLTNNIGIEGIPATADKEYFHCENPQEYEKIIRKIISTPECLQEIAVASKKCIECNFNMEEALTQYVNRIINMHENKMNEGKNEKNSRSNSYV